MAEVRRDKAEASTSSAANADEAKNSSATKDTCASKWTVELTVAVIVIFSLIWVTLVVLFDINRFHGYCAERDFNDSIGPPIEEGDRTICRVQNESERPTPPGKLPGQIFTNLERSRPSWIVTGVLSSITAVLNFLLLRINLWGSHANKNKKPESATDERIFDPHPNENWRISWILYGCTAAIVVDYSITIGMIIDCRGGQGDELFYALMLTFDVVAQASFIVTEVAKRRYLGDEARNWRKALFIFLAVNNFVLWGHSIADNVCRYEVDNGAIVGQQLWSFLDPLFGSTIVFFRILSGCLYISLAYYSHHDRVDARSGSYYLKRSEPSNLEDQALKSTNRKMLQFMMSGDLSKASGEHKMKKYRNIFKMSHTGTIQKLMITNNTNACEA